MIALKPIISFFILLQEMRAQSGSSSGGSFSSTSKISFNNTPKSRRSQFFFPVSREVNSDQKTRPRSEFLMKESTDSQIDPLRASSMPSCLVDLNQFFCVKKILIYGQRMWCMQWFDGMSYKITFDLVKSHLIFKK